MTTGKASLDQRVENLCEHGCGAVRGYIDALRRGQELPQFAGLDRAECELLRRELEAIMAVYGNKCEI